MRWTPVLILLLLSVSAAAGEVAGDSLGAARLAAEARLKRGDALSMQGDLDGAIAEYRKAVEIYEKTLERVAAKQAARASGAAGEAGEKAPAPPPVDDGTEKGRGRVIDYYGKILASREASSELRYNAAVQLGEIRDGRARQALAAALENDPAQRVRRAAAWALGRLGREGASAIPILIAQVGSDERYVGYMAARALGDLTEAILKERTAFGFKPSMSRKERQQIQRQWEVWYGAHRAELGAATEPTAPNSEESAGGKSEENKEGKKEKRGEEDKEG